MFSQTRTLLRTHQRFRDVQARTSAAGELKNRLLETDLTRSQRMTICRPGDEGRDALESLVRNAFARQHGAQVHSFMPSLLGLWGTTGRPAGAVGYRGAEEGPLFLENYLSDSVEALIERRTAQSVARREIVEVGNLAGVNCRAACRLVAALPPILLAQGRRWIVFTATATVRAVLTKLGASLVELAAADAVKAPAGDDWGRYYTRDPRVMVGYLPELLRRHRPQTV